ncbi:MAG: SPOR domain-containing protein [Pseudomonadota bacterium]|nr:SPOR domain-containing protein [Pseudomonadota bacterium]
MEVRVRERLIGALVLVAIVVLFVPAILKGRGPSPVEPASQPTRRVEVPIGDAEALIEEQILVPEPTPATPPPLVEAPPAKSSSRQGEKRERQPEPKAADTRSREVSAKPPEATVPLAAAKPAPAAVQTQATAWAVQLGAFSNRAKAEQLVAELRKRRYSAFLLEYRATGQVLYRVRVGPEQDRARAEEIAARLSKDGFQPVVARHP